MRISRSLLALLLVLVARPGSAQDPARMEEVIQSRVSDSTFMGSVLVARDETVILNKGYGFANVEWQIPNSPTTRFRLGSLTKQFTSASILLLEERGKLSLDDHVKKYLPDAPASWDAITIFNLLTHTSGIFNYTALPDFATTMPLPLTPAQIIAKVRDRALDFEPGSKMSYSNSGYIVLGMIIENVSGESYASFLQKNLFDPIGMKDSGYDSYTRVIPHRASGYVRGPNGPTNAAYLDMSLPYAAGALYSTTEDLRRFEQALFGGRVLKPASLEKMTTPFKGNYALGVVVREHDGHRVIEHNGGINGFNTYLAFYPESRVTVAVLANVNGPAPEAIGAALATLAHGGSVQLTTDRHEVAVPTATLSSYVGTYEVGPNVNLMVTLDADHLMAQLSGQAKFQLFAESETRFFVKVVDAQLDFVKDASGAVAQAVLHQNGRDITATKKSDRVAERQAITLPKSALEPLVGTYQLRPGADLTVTLEGDHLMAQLTGQPKFELFAERENSFFYKVVDAQLEFTKDAGGAVTAAVLHQGPANLTAPRK
ncbi:MAG TPA: serine hydrolase [Vicinamibacterales bacterium]